MKFLTRNKILLYCLIAYFIGQILLWHIIGKEIGRLLLFGHEAAYLIAVIFSCWLIMRKLSTNKLKTWLKILLIFFSVNLLLFTYWIFKVYLNPDINWELQGNENEVDP